MAEILGLFNKPIEAKKLLELHPNDQENVSKGLTLLERLSDVTQIPELNTADQQALFTLAAIDARVGGGIIDTQQARTISFLLKDIITPDIVARAIIKSYEHHGLIGVGVLPEAEIIEGSVNTSKSLN